MARNKTAGHRDWIAEDMETWAHSPLSAFESWLGTCQKKPGVLYEPSSIRVMRSMWSTYCKELLAARGIDPTQAAPEDVKRFLDTHPSCIRAEARQRYAKLLERAYSGIQACDPDRSNPATGLGKPAAPLRREKPMPFLTPSERDRLFECLASPSDFTTPQGLLEARSKALCALMLGAGFKPGQAIASSVNCVNRQAPEFAWAPPLGPIKGHESLLDPRARSAIMAWIDHLDAEPHDPMFPSSERKGAIDYANAFLGVQALLEKLGIFEERTKAKVSERASPQTLRNTYGAQLMDQGRDVASLAQNMGFKRLEFAERFAKSKRAWDARSLPQRTFESSAADRATSEQRRHAPRQQAAAITASPH